MKTIIVITYYFLLKLIMRIINFYCQSFDEKFPINFFVAKVGKKRDREKVSETWYTLKKKKS